MPTTAGAEVQAGLPSMSDRHEDAVHKSEQRFHVDGVLAVSNPLGAADLAPLSDLDGNSDPITIGVGCLSGQDTLNGYFRGAVDEVAIYFSALEDAEVAAIHEAAEGICR